MDDINKPERCYNHHIKKHVYLSIADLRQLDAAGIREYINPGHLATLDEYDRQIAEGKKPMTAFGLAVMMTIEDIEADGFEELPQ